MLVSFSWCYIITKSWGLYFFMELIVCRPVDLNSCTSDFEWNKHYLWIILAIFILNNVVNKLKSVRPTIHQFQKEIEIKQTVKKNNKLLYPVWVTSVFFSPISSKWRDKTNEHCNVLLVRFIWISVNHGIRTLVQNKQSSKGILMWTQCTTKNRTRCHKMHVTLKIPATVWTHLYTLKALYEL